MVFTRICVHHNTRTGPIARHIALAVDCPMYVGMYLEHLNGLLRQICSAMYSYEKNIFIIVILERLVDGSSSCRGRIVTHGSRDQQTFVAVDSLRKVGREVVFVNTLKRRREYHSISKPNMHLLEAR